MRGRLLLLFATSGCAVHTTALIRGTSDDIEGGGVSTEGVVGKLRFGIEAGYERVDDEDRARRGVVGFDYTARFGVVAAGSEKEGCASCDEPWFDFGPGAGFGLATPTRDAAIIGHAWLGGWANVRLWPSTTYPVLRAELQHDAYSGELRGGTQFVVGLGFVTHPDTRW